MPRKEWTNRLGGVVLVLATGLSGSPAAHADLYRAQNDYKSGDYAHAFQEFLTLAQLGQPLAQLDVAIMYHEGRGTDWSDVNAYAWATLAAKNGEAEARTLAGDIRPKLAPGSERVAAWITAPSSSEALSARLLPELVTPKIRTRWSWAKNGRGRLCHPVKVDKEIYPVGDAVRGVQGSVFAEYTLDLLKKVEDAEDDPIAYEISAAAEAASGEYPQAVRNERKAIHRARELDWDLSPLEQRLARYQDHQPWYGNLLEF